MDEVNKSWVEKKSLTIAWLLFFFPVGIYAVWKGHVFDRQMQLIITVATAVVLYFLSGSIFMDVAYILAFCPFAIYLMWKDPMIAKATIYMFGTAYVALIILTISNVFYILLAQPEQQSTISGGSCTRVLKTDTCTYYRDSDCRVIARDCK